MDILENFEFIGNTVVADHLCYKQITIEGFRPHTHDFWELIYIKTGSVSYLAEGRCYSVESGSCILTRPGTRHTIRFRGLEIYDRYTILLNSPLFDNLPETLEVVSLGSNPIVQELFHKMDFYVAYLEGSTLETMLTRLAEEAVLNLRIFSSQLSEHYTANPIITQAVSYIGTHLHEQLSLEALCSQLHITKSYLHRLFVEHLQLTPGRYITAKRLDKARMEIRAGCKPAKVFGLCGFQNYCTFYRNYVQHFGYSPSEEHDHPSARQIEW